MVNGLALPVIDCWQPWMGQKNVLGFIMCGRCCSGVRG